jgi:hypothetical protein
MEIHKPHAAKTWKEFFIELGTVVLGILIALSLEQAVENWREHRQYQADRQAVRTELGLAIANVMRRREIMPCIVGRLDTVDALLDDAEAHRPFAPLSWIGSPQSYVIRTTSETDVSRSNLFPTDEQQTYGLLYVWLHSLSALQDQEKTAWSHLQPLEGRTSLTPEMIARLREAEGEARMTNDRVETTLNWFNLFVQRYDIPTRLSNEWTVMRPKVWPICLPTSTPRAEGQRQMFEYQLTHKLGE